MYGTMKGQHKVLPSTLRVQVGDASDNTDNY